MRKVTGGTIQTFAGTGQRGLTTGSGSATAFNLTSPTQLSLDASGNLWIADSFVLRKVTPGGALTTEKAGKIITPSCIAIDRNGNLYAAGPAARYPRLFRM